MAILLYPNGLTEEFKPKEHTFTDKELLSIFPDFDKIRTFRLSEIPNTWCLWGEHNLIDKLEDEFSKLGSDILKQLCYSPLLFIHDTEINLAWRLTDIMILFGYDDFKKEMLKFFDDIAVDIWNERERIRKELGHAPNLMILEQTGVSKDKRIIFKFDIEKQVHEFFEEKNLMDFAMKIHNFLKSSYKDGDIFAIYADKNVIIIMIENQVKLFIQKIIDFFESKENYEACSLLRNTYEKWVKYKEKNPKFIESDNKNEDKKTSPETPKKDE